MVPSRSVNGVTRTNQIRLEIFDMSLIRTADDVPVPLKICFPKSSTDRLNPSPKSATIHNAGPKSKLNSSNGFCMRRSPRFSAVSAARDEGCGVSVVLRRSPRFSNCSSEVDFSDARDVTKTWSGNKKRKLGEKRFDEKSLRRSPRFVSSSEAVVNGTPKSPSVKVSQKPYLCFEKSLRRSPRFVSSSDTAVNGTPKSASVKVSQKPYLCFEKSLRRSPRFVSSSDTAVNGTPKFASVKSQIPADGGLKTNAEKGLDMACLEEKCLRRSPRLSSSTSGTDRRSSESTQENIKKRKLLEEKCLRRSPRLSLTLYGKDDKNGPLALKRHDTKSSGEKHFKGSSGGGHVNELLSRIPDELAKKKSRTTLEKFKPSIVDKPLLRQCLRTDTPSGNGNGNGKTPNKSIELPKSTGKQPPNGNGAGKTPIKSVELPKSTEKQPPNKTSPSLKKKHEIISLLFGDPIPSDEAQEKWRWRYEMKIKRSKHRKFTLDDDDEDKIVWNVESHYSQAKIGEDIFNLGDCAYIEGDGGQEHIGRIIEFFKTTDGEDYFRVQWFYRAEDTVMKEEAAFHDKKRIFYSTIMNDNPIECIISKLTVTQISPRVGLKFSSIPLSDFYFDTEYCVEYSTFRSLVTDNIFKSHHSLPTSCIEPISTAITTTFSPDKIHFDNKKRKLALLDLYSGCGGMSTGLCLGARASGSDLVTRWALDSDRSACESLKLNHPKTLVRNEAAEDFLELLKAWQKLCKRYASSIERTHQSRSMASRVAKDNDGSPSDDISPEEYEVSSIVDICYGDPDKTGKHGLKFKVHWKGYDASEDSWEPADGLSNCQDRIHEFVRNGFKSKILPLPGDVDVICGGPPCQGISGYNRFRNVASPLADERNRQIIVFMDIVQFLRPKFVLMENVADILRFDNASLGRYALSRLVHLKYQARLGTIAAGCYGLPQFRLRVFLWGAHPSEKLPKFPLPTHDVIVRYWPPPEFERNTVAYDEGEPRKLERAIVLQDAISDLPNVTNHETLEEMSYDKPPETDFQLHIRSTKDEITGSALTDTTRVKISLYDHLPLPISEDDYVRVCQIPKRKGANFRDLPGVIVGEDNVARRDTSKEQMLLPSGKPLVPDYALNFEQGKSKRPFARLWWDETVPTVVTFPNCHAQALLHPEQDRILTVRECARLQGFPDYYRFCGTIKMRYRQVGNAVAIPVARALGYALGMAFQKQGGDEPLMTLPQGFSHSTCVQLAKSLSEKEPTSIL
ncbi:DNA (cytosine-5)-methyltransferase CMT2-like isoform X2 [Tripterygium wilfordii]|uniref:DNA (cytosine-5)-methyltransferase CMT2-like isoform X2 n=1 Tax=Tripterygium wilfordii TaxID=458696 RepID=UPI0018F80065|nr:DNA (cytosine-5)-methyltransferase CMT2-like isoform X2 [Tripterygium wilfordii]